MEVVMKKKSLSRLRNKNSRKEPHFIMKAVGKLVKYIQGQYLTRRSMSNLVEIVQEIHASESKGVIITAGGGFTAVSSLLSVSGASRTLLEACVPYSHASLANLLSTKPTRATSTLVARDMAQKAYERALYLSSQEESILNCSPEQIGVKKLFGQPLFGLGATASLCTDRARHGLDQAFIAIRTHEMESVYRLVMKKGNRNRFEEEACVSSLVIQVLRRSVDLHQDQLLSNFDLPPETVVDSLQGIEEASDDDLLLSWTSNSLSLEQHIQNLADEKCNFLIVAPQERPLPPIILPNTTVPGMILPGSFNPIHEGHLAMARAGATQKGSFPPIWAELSIINVDKPMIPIDQILSRVNRILDSGLAVAITRAAKFNEKAKIFPGCDYIIGVDTALRIIQPKYYKDDHLEMVCAIKDATQNGSRFYVAGRHSSFASVLQDLIIEDRFISLCDLPIPQVISELFVEIPELRIDISSSLLRRSA